jgi:hypothetical protein
MKLSTLKLLVPIVAVTVQSNSASTVIPPYLDHMQTPVALIGTLISLGPVFALISRLPMGMAYNEARARLLYRRQCLSWDSRIFFSVSLRTA